MIWLLLSCVEQNPSALDQQFCEERCDVAGAALCTNRAWVVETSTRTEVVNGDVLCTCCFPKGAIHSPSPKVP